MDPQSNLISGSVIETYHFLRKTNQLGKLSELAQAQSINQYIKALNKVSEALNLTDYEFGKSLEECKNKFKGNMFELFTVIFLNNFGGDRSFLIHRIKWAPKDQEGWDFQALNKLGKPVTIQSKFIGNSNYTFEGDGRLETFFANLIPGQEHNPETTNKVLFTTASKIGNRYLKWGQDRHLTIIDKKVINKFTKNNIGFWNVHNDLISWFIPVK